MSKIISELVVSVQESINMPEEVNKKWEEMSVNNAELGNARRKRKIKNQLNFEDVIVLPSNDKLNAYIHPDFISNSGLSKKEIISKHYKNLAQSFQKYQDKLDRMHATVDGVPSKRYKDALKRGAKNYGKNVAEKLLAFTGMRSGISGCSAAAIKWLDGQQITKVFEFVSHTGGSPVQIAKTGLRSAFKSCLEQRLVQAGATIRRSDFAPDIVKRQNDITNDLMNALTNPALNLVPFETGGESHVDFRPTDGKEPAFRLDIRVSQK
ncbi:MAG: hypothetical protein AAB038_05870 [Planctomycetota bacterium]